MERALTMIESSFSYITIRAKKDVYNVVNGLPTKYVVIRPNSYTFSPTLLYPSPPPFTYDSISREVILTVMGYGYTYINFECMFHSNNSSFFFFEFIICC